MDWTTRGIKETIMQRDGISAKHADELIAEAKLELQELLDNGNMAEAEDICATHFGLEPDYVLELVGF